MIAPSLAAFLEEGIGIHLGTRSADLVPEGIRAIAARVERDGAELVVYVPERAAGIVLAHLRSNRHGAVLFGRPVDDRSVQVKGLLVDVRPGRDEEAAMVRAQWNGFLANLGLIGVPAAIYDRYETWPVLAIRLRVTALFEQTPGPSAGAPIT